jgi:hypothetical protein
MEGRKAGRKEETTTDNETVGELPLLAQLLELLEFICITLCP